jgi:Domain of unknown function (DUF1735)
MTNKMKHITFKYALSLIAALLMVTSCIEEPKNAVDGVGKSRFRVPIEENYSLTALDAAAPTATIFTIYRDAISNADLNTTATMNYEISQALLDEYNIDHDLELVFLDPAIYTLQGATGGSISFAAGEAQKEIGITVDVTTIDFDTRYAVPISFSSASGPEISKVSEFAIIEIGVKNKYDGEYGVSITQSGWGAYGILENTEPLDYPGNLALLTTGATTCGYANVYRGDLLLAGLATGPAATAFGATSPAFTFNETGKLIEFKNAIPDDGRGRTLMLNPNAPASHNQYDDATKSITVNFIFKQNTRPDHMITWKMVYKKPRG